MSRSISLLVYTMMLRSTLATIRRMASLQDDGRFVIPLLTALGAFASLVAIVSELGQANHKPTELVFATLTVALSWAAVHTGFALHYAHEYYRGKKPGGLQFPSGDQRRARRLLGLRVFLVRDRHDRAGVRCRHHRQDDPPHGDGARNHLVRVQHRVAGADGQYRRQRALEIARSSLPHEKAPTLTSAIFQANWPRKERKTVEANFQLFLILLAVLAGTALLARRVEVAPAILLLLAGIALAFVPGMPSPELPPELILLLVLPPLIYSAAVAMSWREFKFNLRPIILLSVGCVIFTAFAVAAATHYLIGLPWNVGFLLGAIVAPPDVVAPLAVARKLAIPRRIMVVLEGEGLANDATALILYRFAVVAISTGVFSLPKASRRILRHRRWREAFGIAVGWLSLRARHWARDPQIEITLSLITPYVAYWLPERFGGSGVIATVACGLYMSWNGPLLISAATRLQGIFFWNLVIYLIEGLLFLLTGFQMRLLFEKSKAFPLDDILIATALVTVMIVIARFAWTFPAIYLPRMIGRIRERDPAPPWQWAFVLSFTGVRGAVSLAAALALPFALPDGSAFP